MVDSALTVPQSMISSPKVRQDTCCISAQHRARRIDNPTFMKQSFKLLSRLAIMAAVFAFAVSRVVAQDLTATYVTGNEVPVTSDSFLAEGKTITVVLNFAPQRGAQLMVVRNTGSNVIGQFSNLAQGQTIALTYAGITYHFVANYYGGDGNDLVLLWTTGDELVAPVAKQKLDGQLLLALRQRRHEPPFDGPTNLKPDLPVTEGDRVLVDIEAVAPNALAGQVTSLGAALPDGAVSNKALRALIPLSQIEILAARPDVKSISAAKLSVTSEWDLRREGGKR